MKLKQKLGILAALVITLGIMAYFPYKTNSQIENDIRNRTVKINTVVPDRGAYQCTGTLLGHNFVLTNAHCFPKQRFPVYIRKANDVEFMPAVLISSAPKTDYALLTFAGKDDTPPLEVSRNWNLGEDIVLYGNPEGADFVLGHSRIIAYTFIINPMHKMRTMIVFPCNEGGPGFSGSGIYNLKGEYLGTFELGQDIPIFENILEKLAGQPISGPLCFAIPAKEVLDRNLDKPWFGFDMTEDK